MNAKFYKYHGQITLTLFTSLVLIVASANLRAATITVTNTADSGVGTLRAALANANNGDTINFALPIPAKITLTSGELIVTKSVNILGPGASNLAVDGNHASRVLHISNNIVVTVAGLTITNGFLNTNLVSALYGGGIRNDSSTLTVSNCTITGNSAAHAGGIVNGGATLSSASLTLIGSTVTGNVAAGNGGGIHNYNFPFTTSSSASLNVINSTISGNSAQYGGGISIDGYTGVVITEVTNSVVSSNSASGGNGGGIYNYTATLTVSNCALNGNSAQFGGGIYSENGGGITSVQIASSTVSGNSASRGGGADNNGPAGDASFQICSSTLSGNSASGEGGGIANEGGGVSASLEIFNSTVSGNSAQYSGGGIYNDGIGGGASLGILNSTLAGNSAPNGGGIYNLDTNVSIEIGSTILDTGVLGQNLPIKGTITSLGFNLCSDGGGGFLANATDQINTDPMLGPLQDNGGPTFTHAPLPGSPAIDKGTNFSASATDQRGLPRTFDKAAIANAAGGDGTDIGAVESQSYTVVNTNDSGTGSLRQAIADSNAHLGTNTIDFAPSAYGTILLTSGELLVSESVNILGPGPSNLAVDGNAANRVLIIAESNAVTISDLTITNGLGGIICGGNEAATTVSNCMVVGNLGFGGIGTRRTFFGPAGVQIVNSTLSGNSAHRGGGINNVGTAVTVLNCTLSRNAADYGGAIFNDNFGSVTIHNCTLSGNSAQVLGGGIYSQSTATAPLRIGSTVFSAGVSGANISTFVGQVCVSDGYNLCSDNGGGVLTNATDQINTDPLLGPLQDNGGPTFTHAPLPGSPAIDKGRNFSGSATDERGFARTLNIAGIPNAAGGDGTDIGALEIDASLRLVNPGIVANQFGFNLVGPFTNIVVEASTNVTGAIWLPLSTNTLGDAALRINDSIAPNLPKRFYRARLQ